MPIDREDGRHWCDPGSEIPGEDGTWTCVCEKTWRQDWDGVWRDAADEVPERPVAVEGEALEAIMTPAPDEWPAMDDEEQG